MFYHSSKLQYTVRVDKPDPQFAKYLQQAIGGIEGEIRVAMQYFFQAMGARGDKKYRDMIMMTATEELSHVEFLCHAVALNLEGAPLEQEEAAQDPMMEAVLGGMSMQHILSSCMCAMPIDASRTGSPACPSRARMASCARFMRDADIISIARVIWAMFRTDPIRPRMSLRLGIG